MHCPFCTNSDTKVIDSRLNQTGDITRRRRECPKCDGRFTTYERVEELMPVVIKKDGRRESYNRDKIFSGIQKSAQKRPVTTPQIEKSVSNVERRIQKIGLKEIPAKAIGELVMHELRILDKVAYVRFASMYRTFQDVDDFVQELKVQEANAVEPLPEVDNLSFEFMNEAEEQTP
jgi:transcriptional repressor NrdR